MNAGVNMPLSTLAPDGVCTYDPETSPYRYYHANGTTVAAGRSVSVPGFTVPVCVFTTDACRPDIHLSTGCCETTKKVDKESDVWLYPFVGFMVPYVAFQFWKRSRQRQYLAQVAERKKTRTAVRDAQSRVNQANKMIQDAQERHSLGLDEAVYQAEMEALQKARRENIATLKKAELLSETTADDTVPEEDPTQNPFWSSMKNFSKCRIIFVAITFLCVSTAAIFEKNIMKKSIQTTLTPTNRATQMAMDALLTPAQEVFAFLEDTMTVKVGYALASERYGDLNVLLNISVLGGILCGLVAFATMFLLTVDESMAGAILNPSEDSNALLIARGCALIPTTDEILVNAKAYWLLSTSAWLPLFMSNGINGFFVGTADLPPMFIGQLVNVTVPIGLWFGLLHGTQMNPLTILALAYSVPQFVTTCLQFCYLAWNKTSREKYAIKVLCPCSGHSLSSSKFFTLLKECAVEGAQLMLVDVSVQMSTSVTNYVAASEHFETAFKLGAAESAYWSFGPQYLLPTMMLLKIFGAKMIANGNFIQFLRVLKFVTAIAASLALAAILAAALKADFVAFDYGSSACIYASQAECVSAYASIFHGENGLDSMFDVFGPTVGLNLFFVFFRSSLVACHDFAFVAKGAVGSLVLVYVPAILMAKFIFKTAVSYYIAMYAPHVVLLFLFGWRMWTLAQRMQDGRDGPWTVHVRKMSHISDAEDTSTFLNPEKGSLGNNYMSLNNAS